MRLIPPQYVKPFVKRGKNDRNDAEAICEAGGRPAHALRAGEVGRPAGRGDRALSARELLVRPADADWSTRVRGHAAEFGVVAAKGTGQVRAAVTVVAEEPQVPQAAKAMLAFLGAADRRISTREIARARGAR